MYTVSRQKKYIADLFILIPNRIAGITLYINPCVEGLNIPLYVKFKGKFMKTIFKCQKKRTVTLRHSWMRSCMFGKGPIKYLPVYVQTFRFGLCV